MYTTIDASKEQIEALLNRHLKPFFDIGTIIPSSFSSTAGIGFVTLHTITGKKIEYQLLADKPTYVEFTGFGDIRYDVNFPEESNQEMFEILKKYGIRAKTKFWKGCNI